MHQLAHVSVRFLIGADVPEARWTLGHNIGGQKQPYVIRTTVERILLRPVDQFTHNTESANHIGSEVEQLTKQLDLL